jgi:hypothetical protein
VSIVVEITEVSAVLAALGVMIGVVYYILDLRHQSKMRQTDLLVRLYSTMQGKDWLEAWDRVDSLQTADLIKMRDEHRTVEINQVSSFFNEIGILLQMRLVDIDLVEKLLHGHVKRTWEKLKPVLEYGRKLRNDPRIAQGFEYLYSEMKKREQKLQASTA